MNAGSVDSTKFASLHISHASESEQKSEQKQQAKLKNGKTSVEETAGGAFECTEEDAGI